MTTGYHEPHESLSTGTRDIHRALASLIEELEAVDWYQQRADVTRDDALRAILIHNRDEEIEHAAMTLEWLRRRLPELDRELRQTLFRDGEIVQHGNDAETTAPGDLGLGPLKQGA